MFLRKFFDKVGFGFSCVEILQKMSFYAVASGRKMGVYKTWYRLNILIHYILKSLTSSQFLGKNVKNK